MKNTFRIIISMIFTRKYFYGEKKFFRILLFKTNGLIFHQKNTDILLFYIHELEMISNIKKKLIKIYKTSLIFQKFIIIYYLLKNFTDIIQ